MIDTFTTARLRAERMTGEHLEYLAALHRDPEVAKFIGGVRTTAETEVWLQRNLAHWTDNGFGQWMLRDEANQLVGRAGLRWIDPSVGEQIVEIGYTFQRSAWGLGYATEAATAVIDLARDHYAMDQLGALTMLGNDASEHVLTKCGFRYERRFEHPAGTGRFYRLTL